MESNSAKCSLLVAFVLSVLLYDFPDKALSANVENGPKWDRNGYVLFCLCMGK